MGNTSINDRTIIIEGIPTRIADLVSGWTHYSTGKAPSEDSIVQAARFLDGDSPAMVRKAAIWLDMVTLFQANGFDKKEINEIVTYAIEGLYGAWGTPPIGIVTELLSGLPVNTLRDLRDIYLKKDTEGSEDLAMVYTLLLLEEGDPIDASLYPFPVFKLAPHQLRMFLTALPEDQRESALLANTDRDNPGSARGVLRKVIYVIDLCNAPAMEARIGNLMALGGDKLPPELQTQIQARKVPPKDEEGLTSVGRIMIERLLKEQEDARKKAGVYALAQHACTIRYELTDAVELSSLEKWTAASQERREAIAKQVLEVLGKSKFKLLGFEEFVDVPIAVFEHKRKKDRFSLVPGGTFQRGFSEIEEGRIREEAKANTGIRNYFEEYEALFVEMAQMRPVATVTISPLLIGQKPGEGMKPEKVAKWLEKGPYRLPTEAEWEYCARGAESHTLNYFNDEIPKEAWFLKTQRLGKGAANRFGLWGFGFSPEICADSFKPNYLNVPNDGSPALGAGPLVARGGAAEIYPWQECGEWHLLLNAMRTPSNHWDFFHFVRPVIGLSLADG